MEPTSRTSRPRTWLKPSLRAIVTLLVGGGCVLLSLFWIGSYSFKLAFDATVVKKVAVISECPGQYKIMMTARVNEEEWSGLFSAPAHNSPGDLTVEIRRDDAASSSPSLLGCNKFSLQTFSYWTDSEAMVHAIVSKSGKESALREVVSKSKSVLREEAANVMQIGSFRRAYPFDVVSTDSEAVALVMRLHSRKMGVGQVYGKKVVNLVYDGTDSRMHPSLTIEFPFGFEITSTIPANAVLVLNSEGDGTSVSCSSLQPNCGSLLYGFRSDREAGNCSVSRRCVARSRSGIDC